MDNPCTKNELSTFLYLRMLSQLSPNFHQTLTHFRILHILCQCKLDLVLRQCKTMSLSVLSVSRVFGLFEFRSIKELRYKTGLSYSQNFRKSYRKLLRNIYEQNPCYTVTNLQSATMIVMV
jgi:hypothetical protein